MNILLFVITDNHLSKIIINHLVTCNDWKSKVEAKAKKIKIK